MDKKTDRLLDSFIRDIGSPDLEVAIEAAKQLRTTAAMKLEGKAYQLVLRCVEQLRLLTSNQCEGTPRVDIASEFRALFELLMSFYGNRTLSCQVSKDASRDLIEQLINLVVDGHMEELESGGSYVDIIY